VCFDAHILHSGISVDGIGLSICVIIQAWPAIIGYAFEPEICGPQGIHPYTSYIFGGRVIAGRKKTVKISMVGRL
jgi:hypothetical protein